MTILSGAKKNRGVGPIAARELEPKAWKYSINHALLRAVEQPPLDNEAQSTIFIFYRTDLACSPMKIPVDEITESAKETNFSERIGELNEIYRQGHFRDFDFPPSLDVYLVYYRAGREIFFRGSFAGILEGRCSRCLRSYSFPLNKEFDFVLSPDPSKSGRKVEELKREDLGLSYYSSDEINLAPLLREQVILALPTRPLCKENCRGLCCGCGVNLNDEPCACMTSSADPRMAIFRTLKVGR
jgi:uncharacterized protein